MKIVNKSYQETESKDLAKAKKELAPLGLEVTFDKETEEYRVNFKGGKEGTAYYTNDVDDAIGTGKAMAKEGDKSKKKESKKKKEDDDQDDEEEEDDDEEDKKDDKEEGKKKKKENFEPSYEDVVLESEVRIIQDDHVLVLEKGDKIRVLKKEERVFFNPMNIERAVEAYETAVRKRSAVVVDMLLEVLHIEEADDIWNLSPNEFNDLWDILTEYGFLKGVRENSSRLTRNMKESVDPGLVFYMVAEDFGVHLEKLDPRRERVDFLFEIDKRDVSTFENFFDDILKEFYKKVDSRWKISWDQDNDLLVKIFR